jgi:hypothetical protein
MALLITDRRIAGLTELRAPSGPASSCASRPGASATRCTLVNRQLRGILRLAHGLPQPIFDAIVRSASRLCGGEYAIVDHPHARRRASGTSRHTASPSITRGTWKEPRFHRIVDRSADESCSKAKVMCVVHFPWPSTGCVRSWGSGYKFVA